ncbi:TIGR02302 family protein [Bartonella doshiae]|uniref:ATPase involved in DNA repair n=2 Tax=Bartonella doshiae TaxID=33044 RepID=A0A380ZLJ9_BARDO|nr:TIGR02302 family protein [Bartonella doshiae]EJF80447.1 TIGR02302 family protein [Bartonella doshiae NCTC 12862 = ATCC 700133]SUV45886.1 ATPase involved in DNA repair [Bartonella doshiae]
MKNENSKSFVKMKLLYVYIFMWAILFFERIWLRLSPFLLVVSLFCSICWLGIFGFLGYWLHLLLLLLLFFLAVGSLFSFAGFQFPTVREVSRRLEQENGLKNQPLNVQIDHLCPENDKGFSAIIWREHQRRMAEQLHHLKTGFVYFNSATCDPLALRALCILFCVCAFSFSFGSSGGRLADAFDFRPIVDETVMRIDAWVTPPAYTGVAPIYLTQGETTQLSVPEGSNLVVRVVDGAGVTVKAFSEQNARELLLSKKQEKMTLNKQIAHFETCLERSTNLIVSSRHKQQKWYLRVIKDQHPKIHWLAKPGRILTGSLELQYEMDDDYGVTKAFVEIEPILNMHKKTASLYRSPEIKLLLPRGGKGKMRMVQDVSRHPWAGSEVKITLVVEDAAGQQSRSKTFVMMLPQRVFSNPVARAVSELRRLLALNSFTQERVLDMLSALLVRPEKGLQNTIDFLVLQSAWTRLFLAKTEDDLRAVIDYLWQIAVGIEGDQLESVQKNLKQVQAALRDALRYGAPAAEIERLMADLRQAMDNYINALAERAQDNSNKNNSGSFNLSEDTLQKKLNLMEEMATMGSSSAAEQLLSEVEQILDHLQVRKENKNERQNKSQSAQMKEKMDQLGDLMRRQQEILNETHQLEMKQRRGEIIPEEQRKFLKERQASLQSELSELEKELFAQGFKQSDALKEAEKKMNSASTALDHGDHEGSIQNQSDALEALRQGAQNILEKMREMLKKAGDNQNAVLGPEDPLGRPLSSKENQEQEGDIILQESDQMRSRQILEEIRKRLSQEHISETEKNYLEKLLRFN